MYENLVVQEIVTPLRLKRETQMSFKFLFFIGFYFVIARAKIILIRQIG